MDRVGWSTTEQYLLLSTLQYTLQQPALVLWTKHIRLTDQSNSADAKFQFCKGARALALCIYTMASKTGSSPDWKSQRAELWETGIFCGILQSRNSTLCVPQLPGFFVEGNMLLCLKRSCTSETYWAKYISKQSTVENQQQYFRQ